jgi:hypothetical protein
VRKRQDDRELRLLKREPDPFPVPVQEPPEEMDAAESRWDPWLAALAKMEIDETAPPAN